MPSSIVHSYFANDILTKLNPNITNKVDLNYLKIFAQGPDIYYFYNLMIGKKAKKVKEIGSIMHKHDTQKYFLTLINYINDNKLNNNKQVLSYLYGSISHYILDSTTHPFIFYYTGLFNRKDKTSYHYAYLHHEMEYYLDNYFILKREKVLPKDFKVHNYLVNIKKIDNDLKNLINTVTKQVYDIDNSYNYYEKSIFDMKKFYHLFNYDKYGIKKNIYQIIDKIIPQHILKTSILSFHFDVKAVNEKEYFLNLEKETWNHPCNDSEFYNYSFIELYLNAITKASIIILEVDKMLTNHKINNKKLKQLFPNLSYLTGKDCNSNEEIKYFIDNRKNILL